MWVRVILGLVVGGVVGALLGYFGKCSSGVCPLTASPYRGAVFGAVIGAVMLFGSSSASQKRSLNADLPADSAQQAAFEITSAADFQKRVLDAKGVALVDFFSHSCPPCRALLPVVKSLGDKYAGKAVVCKVDVEKNPGLAEKYGVQKIPAVLIMRDGHEVDRKIGLRSESEYAAALDKLLAGS